jgi:[ribosomal protein S5]-alanine N-acetyltransferase
MTDTQRNKPAGQEAIALRGERIYLRRPSLDDAARIFNWERDDVVWRYDPHRPYSNSMAEFLPLFERNYVLGNGRQFWFIVEDEKHLPIGTITYFNMDYRIGHAEIGLGLGEKSSWGRGYGSEAIRTLVDYLFTLPGLRRVYAETAAANRPSRKAFARAGFVEVGEIFDPRSSGDPWILLETWKQRKDFTTA